MKAATQITPLEEVELSAGKKQTKMRRKRTRLPLG